MDSNRRQFDELADRLAEEAAVRLTALLDEHVKAPEERESLETLLGEFREKLPQDLRAGGLKDLTEFGRAVHAEMSALMDAAVRGVAVAAGTLHVTTFPCHNCARHVLAAGIRRVVFIEPYEKSRAEDLHQESVAIAEPEGDEIENRMVLEPFVGVAPRRYLEMFGMAGRERRGHVARKDGNGQKGEFVKMTASPVFVDAGPKFIPEMREYRAKELIALDHFLEELAQREGSVHPAEDTSTETVELLEGK